MEENELRKEDAEDTLVLCGVVGGCAGLGTCLGRYKMCTLPREDAKWAPVTGRGHTPEYSVLNVGYLWALLHYTYDWSLLVPPATMNKLNKNSFGTNRKKY